MRSLQVILLACIAHTARCQDFPFRTDNNNAFNNSGSSFRPTTTDNNPFRNNNNNPLISDNSNNPFINNNDINDNRDENRNQNPFNPFEDRRDNRFGTRNRSDGFDSTGRNRDDNRRTQTGRPNNPFESGRDDRFGTSRDRDRFDSTGRDRFEEERDRGRFDSTRGRDRDRFDTQRGRDRDRFDTQRGRDRDRFDPTRGRDRFDSRGRDRNPFNNFGGSTRTDFGSSFNPRLNYGEDTGFSAFPGVQAKQCPPGWNEFREACYRFVFSPIHNRDDARRNCQAYGNGADLISLNTLEEHSWIVRRLLAIDPQHRFWYVSAQQNSPGAWINADGSQIINLDQAFLPDQPSPAYNNYNYLAYSFSDRRKLWGLLKVSGYDSHQYICEVPLSQVPYIVIEDRDFEYGIDVVDPEKIPRGPYFIQEPKDVVFDLSRNVKRSYVSLSCLAGGWPAPTYEWFKEEYRNNTLISFIIDPLKQTKYTISGGALIIDNPTQNEDRGNYHCVASNEYGSIVSETVSLSFGYIAEFIPSRSIETARQYWGKAIYCDPPQFFPGVHYYWSRTYFPNLLEEDQRVFVSFDGHLYISSVDESDRGKYSCNVQSTVSNSGRNGPFFNLQVTPNGNHQQLQFPNNFPKVYPLAPKAGDNVRIECIAFGYPVPSYNWTRRSSGLPRNAILSNYNRVITLKNVSVEDQGEYICRATNSRLSIENSVTLSIQAAPHFTIPLDNRHLDKDSDLIWTCEAFGIPDVSYQWYKNGRLLTMETLPSGDAGRYFVQDNVLTIKRLDEERDAGMFQCRANNSLAAKFSSAQLRVLLLQPSFKKKPIEKDVIAAEGGNVTIKCEPEAAPRPKFNWLKDGFNIGSGGRRRILPNGALIIDPVSRDDEGTYTCVATNVRGRDESSGKLTVVRGPVLIETLPDRVEYIEGTHMFLRCLADTDDSIDVSYIWKHNGLRIVEDDYRIRVEKQSGYLEIFNLTMADRGDYECVVQTWVGKLRSRVTVEIKGPPGPPGGVQATHLTSNSATVQWTDGAMNGAEAYLYTIEGRTQWDDRETWDILIENATAREAESSRNNRIDTVPRKEIVIGHGLSPWCAYEFRVRASNQFGTGPPSLPSPQYNTYPDAPYIAPRNVGGGGGKTGTLTITWDPLPPKDQNAPGIYYKIFWRLYKDSMADEYQTLELKSLKNVGAYAVSPIPYYYTLFDVRVQAFNDKGPGPVSDAALVYSAEDMPQVTPSFVKPVSFNSTAINATWEPVEETREKVRGELLGYRIRYWRKRGNNLYDPEALNYLSRSKEPHALLVGLQPDTYYYVQVSAYNAAGPGPLSEPQFERTLKKAPQKPPTAVVVDALDPQTIKVTWRFVATSADEESLLGYKVRIWEADQDVSQARDEIVRIGSALEATIGGLQPLKGYVLRVLAFSRGGDGKMSSPAKEFLLGDPSFRSTASILSTPSIGTISLMFLSTIFIMHL